MKSDATHRTPVDTLVPGKCGSGGLHLSVRGAFVLDRNRRSTIAKLPAIHPQMLRAEKQNIGKNKVLHAVIEMMETSCKDKLNQK